MSSAARAIAGRLGRRVPKPHRWFVNPVAARDLRAVSRSRGTFVLRFLVPGALALVLGLLVAAVLSEQTIRTTSASTLEDFRIFGHSAYIALVIAQAVVAALAGLILGAASVNSEVGKRTLDSLLTTPLTPMQVIGGKLSSRLVGFAVLLLTPLPAMLALRGIASVNLTQLLILELTVAGIATLMLSVSIFASTVAKSSRAAIMMALLGGAAIFLVPIMSVPSAAMLEFNYGISTVGDLLGDGFAGRFPGAAATPLWAVALVFAAAVSPAVAFGLAVMLAFEDPTGFPLPIDVVNRFLLLSVGLTLAHALLWLMLAALRLRRLGRHAVEERSPGGKTRWRRGPLDFVAGALFAVPALAAGVAALLATETHASRFAGLVCLGFTVCAIAAVAVPRPKAASADREVRGNPVLWRELRGHLFPRKRVLLAVLFGSFALLAYWYSFYDDIEEESYYMLPIGVLLVLGLFSAATQTTGVFAQEREARTLEVLLTAPIAPSGVVFGKLAGALRQQWLIALLLVTVLAFGVVSGDIASPGDAMFILLMAPGPIVLLAASGTLWSLILKRSVIAATANFITALLLYVGPLVLAAILEIWAGMNDNDFTRWVLQQSLTQNAVFRPLGLLDAYPGDSHTDMSAVGYAVAASTYTVLELSLAAGLVVVAAMGYNRFNGRPS